MFRGFSALTLDVKGRLAIPSRYRDRLLEAGGNALVLTINPLDRCLWLYPLGEWQRVETKLMELSDFDRQSRRTKQMMRGHATDCELDGHGRILLPQPLRDYAGIERQVALLGQGNKFELWDEAAWNGERDEWLQQVGQDQGEPPESLRHLSL